MHILIVEDEKGIVDFLKQGLEEEGYTISSASDGEEGLRKALELEVDLVLLDWMLPKIQGIDVCKRIRKEKTNLPIIFLTAKDTVQETIEGLKAGANDYIKKPFSFDELLERTKIHFRTKDEVKVLTLGNITIDKSKFQVFVDKS
uniref:response regulator transcription factor n=1 Tax=Flavobacterium sp. TaxID=239 RepID=UPI00404722DC